MSAAFDHPINRSTLRSAQDTRDLIAWASQHFADSRARIMQAAVFTLTRLAEGTPDGAVFIRRLQASWRDYLLAQIRRGAA